jgi:hypothetical protein
VSVIDEDGLRRLRDDGWAQFHRFLPESALADAEAAMRRTFPDPASVGTTQFSGIVEFPFREVALSLLALHPDVVAVAQAVLGTDELRLYHAEAWAKYTGATDYDQRLHRDFLNHTVLVPSADERFGQILFYLYLGDVTEGRGPTHFVSRRLTAELALVQPEGWRRRDHPELYAAEVSAAGPAGTLIAYRPDTLHRGTNLTEPGAWRHSLLMSFRAAGTEWGHRYGWAERGHWPGLRPFVESATVRQLELIGVPGPGHPYWTQATIAGVAARYPGLDLSPWRERLGDASRS